MTLKIGDGDGPKFEKSQQVVAAAGKYKRSKIKGRARTKGSSHALNSFRELHRTRFTMIEKIQVLIAPPIYPSQVFLGERAIS